MLLHNGQISLSLKQRSNAIVVDLQLSQSPNLLNYILFIFHVTALENYFFFVFICGIRKSSSSYDSNVINTVAKKIMDYVYSTAGFYLALKNSEMKFSTTKKYLHTFSFVFQQSQYQP